MTKRAYNSIFLAGVALFFIQNIYFGWNQTAQSGAERLLDLATTILLLLGAVGGIAHNAIDSRLGKEK